MQEPGAYEVCGYDIEGYADEEGATPADDWQEHEDDCEESSSENGYGYDDSDLEPYGDVTADETRRHRTRKDGLDRVYGFFHCQSCNRRWESSHVYCWAGTDMVAYQQECRKCKTAYFPYNVEPIKCSMCGLTECNCDRSERHVDANKPHRRDLCLKCRAKNFCEKRKFVIVK